MSNRVEELEAEVTELRAAVDGLTEELVETRERLSQLEAARAADSSEPEPETGTDGGVHADVVDEAESSEPDGESESDPSPPTHEDVERAVSADESAEESADAEEAESEESGTDEIIVA